MCEEALEVSAMVSMTRGSAPIVKAKLAPKAWAERSRLPRLTAFETPSMPMAKKPRGLAGGDFTARLCHKRRLGGADERRQGNRHARGAVQRVRRTGEASHRRGPGSDASRGGDHHPRGGGRPQLLRYASVAQPLSGDPDAAPFARRGGGGDC